MYLLLNKNKTNGNRTNSLESVNSLPRTPDSGTSEEEGNHKVVFLNTFLFVNCIYYLNTFIIR